MDYSKIPFHILENQELFPGKLYYLTYPSSGTEEPVLIHPISFSLLDQSAGTTFIRDFKGRNLLLYCLSGNGTFHYQGYSVSFSKGMGFFLDGDDLSEISAGNEGAQYTIYVLTGLLTGELRRISEERNAFSFASDQFHDFEQRQFLLVKSFPGELHDKEYDFSCHMDHLLVRVLQSEPVSVFEKDRRRQMIQQVLTYMQTHFAEDISIKELAAHFHYSSSQFQKCFQEQALCSAKQYLIRIRMQEAEKLLLNSNLSVEEICTRCGFNNANHFIHAFGQYYGKTPLQYRKANRYTNGDVSGGAL